jgi:hypothetical protein
MHHTQYPSLGCALELDNGKMVICFVASHCPKNQGVNMHGPSRYKGIKILEKPGQLALHLFEVYSFCG